MTPPTISDSRSCSNSYSLFFFSSRRRHTRSKRDWSSDVCSSDLGRGEQPSGPAMPLGEVGGPLNGTRSFSWPVDCETNHTSCRVDGPAPMEPDAATAPFQVVYAGQAILSDLSTDVEDIVDGALCGCRGRDVGNSGRIHRGLDSAHRSAPVSRRADCG